MNTEPLHGVVPPVCTPLTPDWQVDTASLERLVDFLLDAGVNGLFVLGSTGEVAFLPDGHRQRVLETVVSRVAGRVQVLAGAIDMTTLRVLDHARIAAKAGCDGVVATAPFYTRTHPAEIERHFRIVAAGTELPIYAYDLPVPVHSKLDSGMLTRLAVDGVLAGVKDSSGDEAGLRRLILAAREAVPGSFRVLTGSELTVDTALRMGVHDAGRLVMADVATLAEGVAARDDGADIGGTKIAVGVIAHDGTVLDTARVRTPSSGGEAVLDAVAGLVSRLREGREVRAVGVGSPGIIDPVDGTVLSATGIVSGWSGTAVAAGLRLRTGLPVVVDNDVRAMALGAASVMPELSTSEVLHVSVGTGVGGAQLRGGGVVCGSRGSAGEIGHLLVPGEGPIPCGCGRRDHLEAIVAGPAVAAGYAARRGTEHVPELPEVVRMMRSGDEAARAAVIGAARVLGRCLAGVVTAFDVDAVVVGGGVAAIGMEFLLPLREALLDEVRPQGRFLPVLPVPEGIDAPLAGAGILATRENDEEN